MLHSLWWEDAAETEPLQAALSCVCSVWPPAESPYIKLSKILGCIYRIDTAFIFFLCTLTEVDEFSVLSFVMLLWILAVHLSWGSLFCSVESQSNTVLHLPSRNVSCSLLVVFSKNLTLQDVTLWWVPSSSLPTEGWNPVGRVLSYSLDLHQPKIYTCQLLVVKICWCKVAHSQENSRGGGVPYPLGQLPCGVNLVTEKSWALG